MLLKQKRSLTDSTVAGELASSYRPTHSQVLSRYSTTKQAVLKYRPLTFDDADSPGTVHWIDPVYPAGAHSTRYHHE